MQLLYIDANPDLFTAFDSLCENIGSISLKTLESGEEALEWLAKSTTDVIISEYNLLGMNGIMLLQALRSEGNSTPFILFTAANIRDIKEKALKTGACSFVERKNSVKTLLQLIRRAYWATSQR